MTFEYAQVNLDDEEFEVELCSEGGKKLSSVTYPLKYFEKNTEATLEGHDHFVTVKFTDEGVSVTLYEFGSNVVLDEYWYTYDELEQERGVAKD